MCTNVHVYSNHTILEIAKLLRLLRLRYTLALMAKERKAFLEAQQKQALGRWS